MQLYPVSPKAARLLCILLSHLIGPQQSVKQALCLCFVTKTTSVERGAFADRFAICVRRWRYILKQQCVHRMHQPDASPHDARVFQETC